MVCGIGTYKPSSHRVSGIKYIKPPDVSSNLQEICEMNKHLKCHIYTTSKIKIIENHMLEDLLFLRKKISKKKVERERISICSLQVIG